MGMAAILFIGAEPLTKFSRSFRQKDPCEIWWKFLKKTLKDFKILYMYLAQGQGQIIPKILTLAKQFYFFCHTL